MSSPDEPVPRRRRRRGRRPATGAEQSPTVTGAAASERDETTRSVLGRRGRAVKKRSDSAGEAARKRSESTGTAAKRRSDSTGDQAKKRSESTGGAAKPAGLRRSRQSAEPSARTIRETERGWRDLAGSGASQLGVSGALRARDVARPGPDELAEAERSVHLVRRQWQPPAAD